MKAIMQRRLAYGLTLPAVLFLAPVAVAQESAPDVGQGQCVAVVEPAAVPVQAEPLELSIALPEALGERLSALFEAESGVEVVEVTATPASGEEPRAQQVSLKLNTSEAKAGEWTLTLANESGRRCSARVTIRAGESL